MNREDRSQPQDPDAFDPAEREESELQDALTAEGLDDSEKAPEQLAAELDDLRNRLLRAVADADNTRKRAARDVKEARAYAVTGFARDLLDVADNLSRAVAAVPDEVRAEAPEAMRNLIEGVEMTERKLLSTLEKHGVSKVDPAPGDAFNPNVHQAAAQIPSDQPSGKIAHVMQPGYIIADRTLRAAMVVVSSGPPAPPPPPPPADEKPASDEGGTDGDAQAGVDLKA
jgi:molecular chaperone GrpE